MPKTSPITSNFTAGELSPRLLGRVDVEQYFNGARKLENMLIAPYGGAKNRPGSYYVATVKDSDDATRIISFEFSITQAYIIEMGDQYMRFYKDNGRIVVTASDLSDFDPTSSYTPAGDFVKVGDYLNVDAGSNKDLIISAPYGTDTSGNTIAVEIAGADTLAVNYVAGLITISLADTTPSKNSADLIQTALRSADASINDWYVTENAAYAAARPTAGVSVSATALTTGDQIYYCIVDVTGNATNTSLFPAVETSYWANQTAYEIDTPYSEADLFDIQFAQSADTLYLTHNDYAPMKLTRTSHIAWTLAAIDYTATNNRAPMMPTNVSTTTITPSADTGAGITLTASAAIFVLTNHVGSIWRVKSGYVEITAVASTTSATATVLYSVSLATGPAATTDWAEGAWSIERGYPASNTFYEQRLVFGGSKDEPQTIWLSVNNEFENMLVGADADDAMAFTIATEQVNAIQWLNAGKILAIGTSGGEFKLWSGSVGAPLTPTNVDIKRETTFGSKKIMPKRIGGYVYYVQRYGLKLREMGYSFDNDNYKSIDMTILSDHITESGIVDMAYQQNPNDMLWCVRSDGEIATFTREIDQLVKAWSRQLTDGDYKSVAVIPLPASDYDQIWTVVERIIGGSIVKYIEYFKTPNFDEDEDAFFVDSGLSSADPVSITNIEPKIELDSMEYSSNVLAQAAYVSSSPSVGVDTNTKLLMHMNGSDDGVVFSDSSPSSFGDAVVTADVNTKTGVKKWGSASAKFDGDSGYLTYPPQAHWSISENWTLDVQVKLTDHVGSETIIEHFEDASNYWHLYHRHGFGFYFVIVSVGSATVEISVGGEITDTDWHHVAVVRKNGRYWGLYVDNTQVGYTDDTRMDVFTGNLSIGNHAVGGVNFLDGYIDELRIQFSNIFSASPNAGKTDTITEPTTAYGTIFQSFSEAIIKQQGSYSLKAEALATASLNETLTRTFSSNVDLTGESTILLNIRASRTGSNIKIGFHDAGGVTTEHTANILAADTWQEETIDISGVADGNKDAIDSIIITAVNADDDNIFYVDNIRVSSGFIVVTAPLHGFDDEDRISIRNVVGMTELNGNSYLVDSVDANSFKLSDLSNVAIDGSGYGDYISGGDVRESINSITGLSHLEGEEVAILTDGEAYANQVVSSGSISLDNYYTQIHVGLPYESTIQLLRPESGSAIGTAQMKTKRIHKSGLRFYRTYGAMFGAEDDLDSIDFGTAFYTGDKVLSFPKGFDRNAYITIKQTQPLPMYLLAVVPWMEVSDS